MPLIFHSILHLSKATHDLSTVHLPLSEQQEVTEDATTRHHPLTFCRRTALNVTPTAQLQQQQLLASYGELLPFQGNDRKQPGLFYLFQDRY